MFVFRYLEGNSNMPNPGLEIINILSYCTLLLSHYFEGVDISIANNRNSMPDYCNFVIITATSASVLTMTRSRTRTGQQTGIQLTATLPKKQTHELEITTSILRAKL